MKPIITVLAIFTLLLASIAIISCSINPATGKMDLMPMQGKADQVALGLQSAPQFEQQGGGKLNNPIIQNYVTSIGNKMAASAMRKFPSDASGFKYTYTVINDTIVNAFALPGGPVYITKGILYKMNNEAQLAFVLGHETGHVVAQHVARQMTQNMALQVAAQGVDYYAQQHGGTYAGAATQAAGFATQMYALKYSRTDESQADHLGLIFTVDAGYNPQASIQVMQVLDSLGSSGPEWQQTHPAPKTRIQDLQAQITQSFPTVSADPKYILNPDTYNTNVLKQLSLNTPTQFTPTTAFASLLAH